MSDFDDLLSPEPKRPVAPVPIPSRRVDTPPDVVPDFARRRRPAADAQPRAGVHPAWAALLAFLAVTFFMLWASTWSFIPGPGPNPNVDPVDGAYVAIFYDDKEMGDYTQDQVAAISSAAIAQFLDENVTGWHKLDVTDLGELENLNPIYAEMADQHRSKLPWVVVRSEGNLGSEPITDPDALIEVVKRTVK